MPRPKLPPGRAATALIGIRLPPEQKKRFQKEAKKHRLTLTEWMLKASDAYLWSEQNSVSYHKS